MIRRNSLFALVAFSSSYCFREIHGNEMLAQTRLCLSDRPTDEFMRNTAFVGLPIAFNLNPAHKFNFIKLMPIRMNRTEC